MFASLRLTVVQLLHQAIDQDSIAETGEFNRRHKRIDDQFSERMARESTNHPDLRFELQISFFFLHLSSWPPFSVALLPSQCFVPSSALSWNLSASVAKHPSFSLQTGYLAIIIQSHPRLEQPSPSSETLDPLVMPHCKEGSRLDQIFHSSASRNKQLSTASCHYNLVSSRSGFRRFCMAELVSSVLTVDVWRSSTPSLSRNPPVLCGGRHR